MRFQGADRGLKVFDLMNAFDSLSLDGESSGPRMVVVSAPMGYGKTRLVQEFYTRLARSRQAAPYWPTALASESELLASPAARRRVSPPPFAAPSGATPSWLWLAPTLAALPDGSPLPALPQIAEQLTAQTPATLLAAQHRNKAALAAGRAATALLPLPDAIGVATQVWEAGKQVGESLQHLQQWRDSGAPAFAPSFGERVDPSTLFRGLAAVLRHREGMRAVIVLDDAQNLDAETAQFVETLMQSREPVLVVATIWPESLAKATSSLGSLQREFGGRGRASVVNLDLLTVRDLEACVRTAYPNTTAAVSTSFAQQAEGNPYHLQLLLTTSATMDSVEDGALLMRPEEVRGLPRLFDDLLLGHWRQLPSDARRVLAACGVLGEVVIADIVQSSLGGLERVADLGNSIVSEWVRPVEGAPGMLQFAEAARKRTAEGQEACEFSPWEAAQWRSTVTETLSEYVRRDIGPLTLESIVLRSMLVNLGLQGQALDESLLVEATLDLAENHLLRHSFEDARAYLSNADRWSAGHSDPRARTRLQVAKSKLALSGDGRQDEAELLAEAARKASEALPASDDTRQQASLWAAMVLRQKFDPVSLAEARRLVVEVQSNLANSVEHGVSDMAVETQCALLDTEAAIAGREGRYEEAVACLDQLFGLRMGHTGLDVEVLGALRDAAYWQRRVRPGSELQLRWALVQLAYHCYGTDEHALVAPHQSNLAFSLLSYRSDDEAASIALDLCERAVRARRTSLGAGHPQATPTRLVRCCAYMRQGLIAERGGAPESAETWFRKAEDEAYDIRAIRRQHSGMDPTSPPKRYGQALACLRNDGALDVLADAVADYRARESRHDVGLLESHVWAARRLGHRDLARQLGQMYELDWRRAHPDFDPPREPPSAAPA